MPVGGGGGGKAKITPPKGIPTRKKVVYGPPVPKPTAQRDRGWENPKPKPKAPPVRDRSWENPKPTPPVVRDRSWEDTTNPTKKLIEDAKRRSASKAPGYQGPEPSASPTGEFTYKMPGTTDINKQIDDIYNQKTPDFLGDAQSDAKRIYAPVFADLTAQQKLAQKNAGSNTKQLNSMYGALASNIAGEGKQIGNRTQGAVADVRENTADTSAAVGSNFSNANKGVTDLMASLGLEAAAGEVLPKGAETQALLQGLVANQGQGSADLAAQLGQNALNYNSAQKNIAGFEGAQNVQANQRDLSDKLAALATTRANVGSQRAGQASSLAQQLRGDYTNSLNSRSNALVQAYAQQQAMAIARMQAEAGVTQAQIGADAQRDIASSNNAAQAQRDAAKASAGPKAPSVKQQYDMADPGSRIFATAAQLFGTSGDAASRAVNLANHVASSAPSTLDRYGKPTGDNRFPTAARFAEFVTQANNAQPPDRRLPPDKMLALAYAMYKSM